MEDLVRNLIEQNQTLIEALKPRTESSRETKVTGVVFEKFDDALETFESFLERFEAYLDIQNVPDEKRGKTLISALSAKLYNLLKNLVSPGCPADKDYDSLKKILKEHLNPKPLIIPSRHFFLNRKQREGESISTYIAELRSLAIPCSYTVEMLNIMLRDVFVSGLRDRAILDRLFEEDNISLENTLKIALAMERASKGANEIIGRPQEIKEFSAEKKWQKAKPFQKKNRDQCTRCTSTKHSSDDCGFKNSKCHFCDKVGHIKKACFKAKKASQNKPVKQKQVDTDQRNGNQNTKTEVPMYPLETDPSNMREEEPKRPPIMLNVKIENKCVPMELDTGGAVSVMSIAKFRQISKKKIQSTQTIFKTYKGGTIVPLGYVTVNVEYNGQKMRSNLYIVKENLDTIFGREWLFKIKLPWPSLNSIKTSKTENLEKLLNEYKELFDEGLGEIKNYECTLELKPDVTPVFCRPRPVPFALKKRVEDEIDRLEHDGIIEKTSISDWATPIVPIVKPNGGIRLCADYSVTVNKNLKVQKHPLPRTEEIFASLSDGKVFSKIDFSQAYLQMRVNQDSQKLLTINTQKGLYTCKRLMYGINAAPAIWQKYIESVFRGLEGVEVFFDDARISAPDVETHTVRLKNFFDRCREHGLKINKEKSKFFQDEIEFLGFKVNAQGLSKTDSKITAMQNAKTPTNVQEIQSFMGLVNFYSKFSKEIATLAYPLHNLTKKGVPWNWDKNCENAFQNVKKEICSEKVLAHYDPNLPILLSSDASPVGIGAVLAHRFPDGTERPIAFASRTLSPTEQRYSQIDKEALAIVWAVKKFYLYLKGNRFTLITDHKPLVAIFECKKGLPILSATRLLHYALILQAYQFDIVYRNTKEHGNADFLSRLPLKSEDLVGKDDVAVFQLTQIETLPVKARDLARETQIDSELGPLYRTLKFGGNLGGKEIEYSLQDDCIMHGQRVCVPKKFQERILAELHQGHIGICKMKAIARSYVYWKDIDRDIESTAKNCGDCARFKSDPVRAKVHHWEYPSGPWERIHIDFAGPIFEHTFLIIVDAHSKWMEVYPLKTTNTTKTIECLRDCFSRFGLPIVLVSDNGSQFTSHEFETFIQSNGIKHKTCAPFKPSSNGQAERYVYTLKQSLRSMQDYPGTIQQKVSTFLMHYRKAPNATTMHSPAMLFLKREIRTRIDLAVPDLRGRVQENIRKGVYEFRDRMFEIGDKVAVRDYRSANSRWKFGSVVNQDGELHYTVDVQGSLLRRHVDQIRPTGDRVEPGQWTPRIPTISTGDGNESPPTLSPNNGTPLPAASTCSGVDPASSASVSRLPENRTDGSEVSEAPPTRDCPPPEPRRSQRIRRPPKRLDL